MSRLDDELKELQAKKLKTEFFKLIKDNIGKIESKDFSEVAKETKDEVIAFVDAQIDLIESGAIYSQKEVDGLFSSDEVIVLKALAERALKKSVPLKQEIKQEPIQKKQTAQKQDQLSFALEWRFLGDNGGNVEVNGLGPGKCVGMVAPNIIVKLNTGVEVSVLPQEITKL